MDFGIELPWNCHILDTLGQVTCHFISKCLSSCIILFPLPEKLLTSRVSCTSTLTPVKLSWLVLALREFIIFSSGPLLCTPISQFHPYTPHSCENVSCNSLNLRCSLLSLAFLHVAFLTRTLFSASYYFVIFLVSVMFLPWEATCLNTIIHMITCLIFWFSLIDYKLHKGKDTFF